MRLIDADALLKSINSYSYDTTNCEKRRMEHIVKAHICELIEQQPTAYDVDNVVERFENERKPMYRADGSLMAERHLIEIDKAVEIAKSSGAIG